MPLFGYRFPEETRDRYLSQGRIIFGEDENKLIELKIYARDYKEKLPGVIELDGRRGANELRTIFGGKELAFKNPKPSSLLVQLLAFVAAPEAVVLDSFAGSGTTAHAVMSLNKRDSGSRKFLLVECEEYADSTTAERVRRVIHGVEGASDGELRLGLSGNFTFCALGDPIDLEGFFDGDTAPDWEQVARYVAYTATGQTLDKVSTKPGKDWLAGEAGGYRIYLIYKPDLDFMRSNEAALDMTLAERISKAAADKPTLVYAAAKFMSQKELSRLGLTFCQLPYAIHRILGDAPDEA